MAGTFRQGDLLILDDSGFDEIELGDVITFRWPDQASSADTVAHRVTAVSDQGLATQGDSNPAPDRQLVTREVFLGRVAFVERGGARRRVAGGRVGRLRARLLAQVRAWRGRLVQVGGAPYRSLRRRGVVAHLWKPRLRAFRFRCGDDEVIRLFHRGHMVGEWLPGAPRLRWRKPYDLVTGGWRLVVREDESLGLIRPP